MIPSVSPESYGNNFRLFLGLVNQNQILAKFKFESGHRTYPMMTELLVSLGELIL